MCVCVCHAAVPPSIVEGGVVQDAKVKERHNVTLTCEVTGRSLNRYGNTFIMLTFVIVWSFHATIVAYI